MNAKETLKKLYEAIGGTLENAPQAEPETEAPVAAEEAPEAAAEPVVEEVTEETPEAAPEAVEAPEAEAQEVKEEEAKEEEAPEAVAEEAPKSDARVEELEKQLADLREILKNAFTQEEAEPAKEAPAEPEVKEEPKGLTHSPEKTVEKRLPKQQQNGGNIQSTVYKYMNNK